MVFAALLMVTLVASGASGPSLGELVTGNKGAQERTNSLDMIFHPLPECPVLMSVWETRVADWQAYLRASGKDWSHPPAFAQTPEHPVVNVTLTEAASFCVWLTKAEREKGLLKPTQLYRLPTHHEWNCAMDSAYAREVTTAAAGSPAALTLRFPWGNEWPPLRQAGNYHSKRIGLDRDDGFDFTAPVGQFAPTQEGFYDLGGNVWEWVTETAQSTSGVESLRGGSWLYWQPECLEAGYRQVVASDTRAPTIGFRCVLDDVEKSLAYKQQREKNVDRQRTDMLDKGTSTAAEIDRVRNEMKSSSQPADEDAKARLRAKPTVSSEEIERARKALEKAPDAAPAPAPQP